MSLRFYAFLFALLMILAGCRSTRSSDEDKMFLVEDFDRVGPLTPLDSPCVIELAQEPVFYITPNHVSCLVDHWGRPCEAPPKRRIRLY